MLKRRWWTHSKMPFQRSGRDKMLHCHFSPLRMIFCIQKAVSKQNNASITAPLDSTIRKVVLRKEKGRDAASLAPTAFYAMFLGMT